MIQYAARRACVTGLKQGSQGRLTRWRVSGNAQPSRRARSASVGPFVASEIWPNPDPTSNRVSLQQQPLERKERTEQKKGSMDYLLDRTPTTLGRNVNRMVRASPDALIPEIVDLVVGAGRGAAGSASSSPRRTHGGGETFSTIAKAYRRLGRQHLTLHLCEAFEESTGEPLVPSTPQGLVLLLDAMRPAAACHARNAQGRAEVGGDERWGNGAVKELLRRYEASGKDVPLTAYKAAVTALAGPPSCSAALEMAREARAKLGDSAKGLGGLYTSLMKQCDDHLAPDTMRIVLRERIEAGGELAPDVHAYTLALGCLGKAKRITEALDLFEEMLKAGVLPNEITVNAMLAACARVASDYWRHSKTIFEGMERRWGVTPNVYHYTSFVTCLLKAGQWGEAFAMTDRMEDNGITPNTRFLDHMMQASVGAKQWVTAEAIFRAMTEKYGHSNVVSRQSTLHFVQSMVMQKKLRKVVSYVARIQDIPLKGRSFRGRGTMQGTLDTALLKWFRSIPGVGSKALAGVLMTMIDKGVRLHPDSYSVVIAKANQDGNKELSETLYKMLVASKDPPSLSAANAAIKGCATVEKALDILKQLQQQGLSPDKFTYAALLHCCSAAVDDDDQGQRATQVWQAMSNEGIVPHGGMLASYVLALMRSGDWKLALEVRERHRGGGSGGEGLTPSDAGRHVDKLDFHTRDDALVDGVTANGLVDNKQPELALSYVLDVLKKRAEEGVSAEDGADGSGGDGSSQEESQRFVDEDNHTVLAGIRACTSVGSCEAAMAMLRACEARWAQGPLARDVNKGSRGGDGQWAKYEWREMLVRTRLSRRRVYDALVSVLAQRGRDFGDIRRVLESGMKNGAVSLMKDTLGGTSAEQAVDFHGWSTVSARCIIRCIVEDLARDKDFLLEMGQYDLGRAAALQGLREFGDVSERWHVDSPDPRGRRREFADGVTPARFAEREYGKGRKMTATGAERKTRWQRHQGGWDGEGLDETQARWWEKGKRLSMIVGKPRPPPCVRNAVEEFCMLGVVPPLRIRKDATNPGILTIEPEDARAWLERDPRVLP